MEFAIPLVVIRGVELNLMIEEEAKERPSNKGISSEAKHL